MLLGYSLGGNHLCKAFGLPLYYNFYTKCRPASPASSWHVADRRDKKRWGHRPRCAQPSKRCAHSLMATDSASVSPSTGAGYTSFLLTMDEHEGWLHSHLSKSNHPLSPRALSWRIIDAHQMLLLIPLPCSTQGLFITPLPYCDHTPIPAQNLGFDGFPSEIDHHPARSH